MYIIPEKKSTPNFRRRDA